MTDEVQVSSVGEAAPVASEPVLDTASPVESSESAAPAAETPKESAPVAEKMLAQSHVKSIVARETKIAAEKARAQAIAEYEKLRAAQPASAQDQATNLGGMVQMTPQQIQHEIRKMAETMTREAMGTRIENEYRTKINDAMENDPEFADAYDALNIEQHPDLVVLTNGLDNTAQVIKDLSQNPGKFAQILMLARSNTPKLAHQELVRLSKSIKANETAQKIKLPQEPLDQIKTSNIGADNGDMTVSDFRKIFRG